jgi:CRISPR/Cas system-associated protein Csx1
MTKNKLILELNSLTEEKEKERKEYFTSFEIFKNEKQKLENTYNLNIQQRENKKKCNKHIIH